MVRPVERTLFIGSFVMQESVFNKDINVTRDLISHITPNTSDRQFQVQGPNQSWVTEFTYIRTHEGWLYLTIILDLFSQKIIGWSMKNSHGADLVIDTLLMALWRRKPTTKGRSIPTRTFNIPVPTGKSSLQTTTWKLA